MWADLVIEIIASHLNDALLGGTQRSPLPAEAVESALMVVMFVGAPTWAQLHLSLVLGGLD